MAIFRRLWSLKRVHSTRRVSWFLNDCYQVLIAMFRQSLRIPRRLFVSNRQSNIVHSLRSARKISFLQKSEKFKFYRKFNCLDHSYHFSTTNNWRDKYLQPTQRLVNPDQIDGVQYVESLCLSLHQSQPERYGFFSALATKRAAIIRSSTDGGI